MDPNTLNLDPNSEFWPNLNPDPGLPMLSILKEKIKNNLRQRTKQFSLNYKKIIAPEAFFSQSSL